ncbi:hypothetical protein UPYG_G00305700 [Umbra pygmaea]|uniref:Uncharacterized protein n=1 Tax=Umbra pygmaea TaxID=75934 RepID=A0ABD0VZQ3_UMBPY
MEQGQDTLEPSQQESWSMGQEIEDSKAPADEATQPKEETAGGEAQSTQDGPMVEDGAQNDQTVSDVGDQTQTSSTEKGEPLRVGLESEMGTEAEKGVRRMTRSLKNQVTQQQIINVDKAMEILDQKIPPLVVDHYKLKELLHRVVFKTEDYEVYQLEKLYALLCQSIYRHRKDYNKTALLKEMENVIEGF